MHFIRINLFFLLSFLFVYSHGFSQNDTLKKIFKQSFSLTEEYRGDWGGYTHTFIFTKQDTTEEILWKDPDFPDGEMPRELKIILPLDGMKKLEKLFTGCASKIKSSDRKSTEHIKYIFKSKELTYTIDDNFTMLCNDDFKEWKQNLFSEGIKQEKLRKKK
ncbi:MAG: hypothetical protein HY063_11270 [Bacteroidetes bacterium]|nr:hypothetical protein [Bacteroidota bacterium]